MRAATTASGGSSQDLTRLDRVLACRPLRWERRSRKESSSSFWSGSRVLWKLLQYNGFGASWCDQAGHELLSGM